MAISTVFSASRSTLPVPRFGPLLLYTSCAYFDGSSMSAGYHYPMNPHICYACRCLGRKPNAGLAQRSEMLNDRGIF